jgi:hypothetical protein
LLRGGFAVMHRSWAMLSRTGGDGRTGVGSTEAREMFLLKAFFVASLVKVLLKTNKPALCAAIYVAMGFVVGLMFGRSFIPLVIGSAIAFALAYLYFWLLNRFEESGVFWVILVLGFFIVLV